MSDYETLLTENRSFPPPDHFRHAALVRDGSMHADAERDFEAFWAAQARELEWMVPFTDTASPPSRECPDQ